MAETRFDESVTAEELTLLQAFRELDALERAGFVDRAEILAGWREPPQNVITLAHAKARR